MKRAPRTSAPAHPTRTAAAALSVAATLLFAGAPAFAQAPPSPAPAAAAPGAAAPAAAAPGAAAPAAAAPAAAAPAGPGAAPPSPENVARMQKLAGELRCLVCQNQTLADSNAELAVELRREVDAMIVRGDSDDQIKQYLVQRYGDFVLYRPPMQGNTLLLWVGPFALLALGGVVWIVVQRRSRRAAEAAPPEAPDAAARRQRTRHLLEE